jgi:apolipoprotein N-acyltransferase
LLGAQDRLAAVARAVARLRGWRRAFVLAAAGAGATLALPPAYGVPVLVLSFAVLLWSLEGAARLRGAFTDGWWFGVGFFLAGLYWITSAVLVRGDEFLWLVPVAVPGVAAGLAIFPGAAAVATEVLVRGLGLRPAGRALAFAVMWTAAEWLRGHVLTGFPWNALGTVWASSTVMLQAGAVLGLYGLSLVTAAAAAAPAALVETRSSRRAALALVLIFTLLVPAVMAVGGLLRLKGGSTEDAAQGPRLRIVQANISQAEKWDDSAFGSQVMRYLSLSRQPGHDGLAAVIWPEGALPLVLDRVPRLAQVVAAAAPPGGVLILGTDRATPPGDAPVRIWNSIVALDAEARVVAHYDKVHLVPFGEYQPLRRLLHFDKLVPGQLDFSPGPGLRTLRIAGLPPFSPLVCYEIIFPGEVLVADDRPRWLLNLTNDAWFGRTAGPYQHFAAARLRAVEEGLPVVRAANTGISAVIDSYGRIEARLGLGAKGVVDAALPPPFAGLTPYARWGDWIYFLLAVVLLAMSLGVGWSRRKAEKTLPDVSQKLL